MFRYCTSALPIQAGMSVTGFPSDPPSIRATVLVGTMSCLRLGRACCSAAVPQLNSRSTSKPTQGQNGHRIGLCFGTGLRFRVCLSVSGGLELGSLGDDVVLNEAPQRDQQPSCERDDAHAPRSAAASPEAFLVPLGQGAIRLVAQPRPSEFDHERAHPRVAGLADTLVVLKITRSVGTRAQAHASCKLAAIIEAAPSKELAHEDPRPHLAQPAQPLQLALLDDGRVLIVRVGQVLGFRRRR